MMTRSFKALCLLTLVWTLLASAAWADEASYIPPEQVRISTPEYQPEFEFKPPFGTYYFTVSWQGIPAADLKVACEPEGAYYHISVEAKTYRGIDVFYRLRYHAEANLSSEDMKPTTTVIEQQENSRRKYTRIEYRENGDVYSYRRTNDEAPKSLTFNPHNMMLEPFSAVFLARSLRWQVGDTREFDSFNGKSRYLISLTAVEQIAMNINGRKRDVFVIVPKVRNLSVPEQTKKLRTAKIYVTADEKREVVKIASEVFIGTVTTKLSSFVPSDKVPMRIAKREEQSLIK